jgi:hypothetical protein
MVADNSGVMDFLSKNWPTVVAMAGGGGAVHYLISNIVKNLPRKWPITMQDIYFCFVDTAQDVVSQKALPSSQQTVVLPPGYSYSTGALQVAHADPPNGTILPAHQEPAPPLTR